MTLPTFAASYGYGVDDGSGIERPLPTYAASRAYEVNIEEPGERRRNQSRITECRFWPSWLSLFDHRRRTASFAIPIAGLFFAQLIVFPSYSLFVVWMLKNPVQLTAYTCPNSSDVYVTCTTQNQLFAVAWSLMVVMGLFWFLKRCIAHPEDVKALRTNKKQEVALLLLPIAMVSLGIALYYGMTSYFGCRAGCIPGEDAYCTTLVDAAGQIARKLPKSCADHEVARDDDWKWFDEK